MEEFLQSLFRALLVVVYILLTPMILIVTTPFILLWPGRKRMDGTRENKNIGARYARVLRIWRDVGTGLPTL
jgi:hypothetical protein